MKTMNERTIELRNNGYDYLTNKRGTRVFVNKELDVIVVKSKDGIVVEEHSNTEKLSNNTKMLLKDLDYLLNVRKFSFNRAMGDLIF